MHSNHARHEYKSMLALSSKEVLSSSCTAWTQTYNSISEPKRRFTEPKWRFTEPKRHFIEPKRRFPEPKRHFQAHTSSVCSYWAYQTQRRVIELWIAIMHGINISLRYHQWAHAGNIELKSPRRHYPVHDGIIQSSDALSCHGCIHDDVIQPTVVFSCTPTVLPSPWWRFPANSCI